MLRREARDVLSKVGLYPERTCEALDTARSCEVHLELLSAYSHSVLVIAKDSFAKVQLCLV